DALAEAERLFPVAAIWNDRLGSVLAQVFAQLGAIVCFVAEHPFRRLHSANEALCDRAIVCFTCGQQDGDKAPFNICECVNLRIAPSARAANSLLLLPPFPPAAERCAFACDLSAVGHLAKRRRLDGGRYLGGYGLDGGQDCNARG